MLNPRSSCNYGKRIAKEAVDDLDKTVMSIYKNSNMAHTNNNSHKISLDELRRIITFTNLPVDKRRGQFPLRI